MREFLLGLHIFGFHYQFTCKTFTALSILSTKMSDNSGKMAFLLLLFSPKPKDIWFPVTQDKENHQILLKKEPAFGVFALKKKCHKTWKMLFFYRFTPFYLCYQNQMRTNLSMVYSQHHKYIYIKKGQLKAPQIFTDDGFLQDFHLKKKFK